MGNAARSHLRFASAPLVDESGIAAVEFAFLAPVALALLSLAFAGGQGLSIYHKTVRTAHIVTDVVSRTTYTPDPNINNAEQLQSTALDGDLALGRLVMYPDDSTNLQIVMTELKLNIVTQTATVVWSEGYNGGVALTCNATITLDPSYYASGATYLVYGQTSYTYQPQFNSAGVSTTTPTFNSGAPGATMRLLVMYQWPVITGPLLMDPSGNSIFASFTNGTRLLSAVQIFVEEPCLNTTTNCVAANG